MIIIIIFYTFILLGHTTLYPQLEIQPHQLYQMKPINFNVSCKVDASNESFDVLLQFSTDKIMKFNVSNIQIKKDLIIGHIEINDKNIHRVFVYCNLWNTNFSLTKEYKFGYSMKEALTKENAVRIYCQDFNMSYVKCCVSPSLNKLKQLTKFYQLRFHVQMSIAEKNLSILSSSTSPNIQCCHGILPFMQSIQVDLKITNEIDAFHVSKQFNRLDILRSQSPQLTFQLISPTWFSLAIDMVYDFVYLLDIECFSQFPIINNFTIKRTLIGQSDTIEFGPVLPYSRYSCNVMAMFDIGDYANKTTSTTISNAIQLPESVPSESPKLYLSIINYSNSPGRYLQNISIYFIDVPIVHRNGLITHYKATCQGHCVFDMSKVTQVSIGSNEVQISNISRVVYLTRVDINSILYIVACTSKGCSKIPTHIIIRSSYESIKKFSKEPLDSLLIQLVDNKYNITLSGDSYDSLILVQCLASSHAVDDCMSIISHRFPDNKRYLTIHAGNWPLADSYFSVISSGNNYSVSSRFNMLHWTKCIYRQFNSTRSTIYQKKLTKLIFKQTKCSLLSCLMNVTLRVMPCEMFSEFLITKVWISFKNTTFIITNQPIQFSYWSFLQKKFIFRLFVEDDFGQIFAFNDKIITKLKYTAIFLLAFLLLAFYASIIIARKIHHYRNSFTNKVFQKKTRVVKIHHSIDTFIPSGKENLFNANVNNEEISKLFGNSYLNEQIASKNLNTKEEYVEKSTDTGINTNSYLSGSYITRPGINTDSNLSGSYMTQPD